MKETTGILLEGGALRSVFTAGVLDYFMDENFYVPNVVALSASAYAGMNYISKQRGRTAEINIESLKTEKYLGLQTLLKTGELFDMDLLFDRHDLNAGKWLQLVVNLYVITGNGPVFCLLCSLLPEEVKR